VEDCRLHRDHYATDTVIRIDIPPEGYPDLKYAFQEHALSLHRIYHECFQPFRLENIDLPIAGIPVLS
jgi:hypothetical protein